MIPLSASHKENQAEFVLPELTCFNWHVFEPCQCVSIRQNFCFLRGQLYPNTPLHNYVKSYLGRSSLWPMWHVLHISVTWGAYPEADLYHVIVPCSLFEEPPQKGASFVAVLFDISPEGTWCFQCLRGLTMLYFVGVGSSHLLGVRISRV